jgi:hypothetical protein
MPNNPSARPDERAVEACAPLRSVDWRDEPQPIRNYHHRLAAHGQHCGEAAPPGEECGYCKRGLGGFQPVSLTIAATRCNPRAVV